MTRLEALRRHSLAHPATCKRLSRSASSDEVLASILNDAGALEGHFRSAARLSRDEVDSLVAPLVTAGGQAPPATEAMIMDVRMVAAYA